MMKPLLRSKGVGDLSSPSMPRLHPTSAPLLGGSGPQVTYRNGDPALSACSGLPPSITPILDESGASSGAGVKGL